MQPVNFNSAILFRAMPSTVSAMTVSDNMHSYRLTSLYKTVKHYVSNKTSLITANGNSLGSSCQGSCQTMVVRCEW